MRVCITPLMSCCVFVAETLVIEKVTFGYSFCNLGISASTAFATLTSLAPADFTALRVMPLVPS